MTSRYDLHRDSGFSMIEFLMTAVILGVGLLGLAALTTVAMRAYGGSRTRDTALTLSSSVMDHLALDGRISAQIRGEGGTPPTTALVANAAADTKYSYQDPATTWTDFDLQGQPTQTNKVFTITWLLRTAKGVTPDPSSNSAVGEVVVNVKWEEVVKGATTQSRYVSTSRLIRY